MIETSRVTHQNDPNCLGNIIELKKKKHFLTHRKPFKAFKPSEYLLILNFANFVSIINIKFPRNHIY